MPGVNRYILFIYFFGRCRKEKIISCILQIKSYILDIYRDWVFFSLMRCKYKGCVYSNSYKQTHPHTFFQTVTMAHWTSMNLLQGDHHPRKFIRIFYLCAYLLTQTLLSLHNLRVMSMILSLISTGVFTAHVSTKIYRMATG